MKKSISLVTELYRSYFEILLHSASCFPLLERLGINSTYDPCAGESLAEGAKYSALEVETNGFCAQRHWNVLHNRENSHSHVGCE